MTVKAIGVPDVEPQYPFEFLVSQDAYVDLFSPRLRHIFECDGKLKYRNQTNWRGDPLTAEDVVWLEKQREDRLRGRNLGFSRLVWSDTRPEAFGRVKARLWQEIRSQNAAGLFTVAGQPA